VPFLFVAPFFCFVKLALMSATSTPRKRKELQDYSMETSPSQKAKQDTEITNSNTDNKEEKKEKLVSSEVNQVVFPGGVISLKPNVKVRVGPGLMQDKDSVVSSKFGILRQSGQNRLWVDNSQKRYIPLVEDLVVGVVIEKHVENYRIDIGGTQYARLPSLSFEGASKRNRPNIPVGGLVYARVVVSNKDMDTELSCTSVHFKKDWVTGESLFGELIGGYCFKCSLSLARTLLEEKCLVLSSLGKHIPFELAIGANGIIWINSSSPLHTVLITNAILNSEHMSDRSIQEMVVKLVERSVEM